MANKELIAVGKMGLGAARVISGVMTGLGKGLLGTYCRNHHLTQLGVRIAQNSIKGGSEMFKDGLKDLRE